MIRLAVALALAGCSSDAIPVVDGAAPDLALCPSDFSTDPANCGRCGRSCLGGRCTGGQCMPVLLADGQNLPRGIAVDGDFVYWVNTGDQASNGAVMKLSLAGGVPIVLAADRPMPLKLVVDGGKVYWTDQAELSHVDGAVMRCDLDGGNLFTLATAQGQVTGLAIDADFVYFAAYNEHAVKRVARDGGPAAVVSMQDAGLHGVALGGSEVFWAMRLSVLGPQGPAVSKAPRTGGPPTTLATGTYGHWLALDDEFVYFTSEWDSPRRVARTGGAATVLAHDKEGDILVDGDFVYWSQFLGDSIMRMPRNGGEPVPIATGLDSPAFLAVDAVAIYFTEWRGGRVWRVAK